MLNVSKLVVWARYAAATAGAQSLVQLLAFATGIIVIRSLPPNEYALYTIATGMVGLMAVLADGGLINAIVSLAGQSWQDRRAIGSVIAAGLAIRRKIAAAVIFGAFPIFAVPLRRLDASWTVIALTYGAVVLLFFTTLTGQLLEAVPRLHQRLAALQGIQLGANAGRLLIVTGSLLYWPVSSVALLAGVLPQWWANIRLRRVTESYADRRQPAKPEITERLWAQVRRTLPAAAYYSFSGQITLWLASFFGVATNVAAIGALSRLAMAMNVIGAVVTIVALPRFARIPTADHQLVGRRYWQLTFTLSVLLGAVLAAVWLFPGPVLAVLGPDYSAFRHEAMLMVGSNIFGMLSGVAYTMAASRGVVAPPGVLIPYCIAVQVCLMLVFSLDTIAGLIWIGLLASASQWAFHAAFFAYHLRSAAALAGDRTRAEPSDAD